MDVVESRMALARARYKAEKAGERCRIRTLEAGQRGVYAIEFGLVFLVFFLVLYAVLTYGMIFAAQQSLNHAAEDGARRALAWGFDPAARVTAARQTATDATGWLSDMAGDKPGPDIKVCYYSSALPDDASGSDTCTVAPETGEIKVDIRYPYRSSPLIPTLLQIGVPEYLYAEATVNLDIASQAVAQKDG